MGLIISKELKIVLYCIERIKVSKLARRTVEKKSKFRMRVRDGRHLGIEITRVPGMGKLSCRKGSVLLLVLYMVLKLSRKMTSLVVEEWF